MDLLIPVVAPCSRPPGVCAFNLSCLVYESHQPAYLSSFAASIKERHLQHDDNDNADCDTRSKYQSYLFRSFFYYYFVFLLLV
jgi:hypothetical protein